MRTKDNINIHRSTRLIPEAALNIIYILQPKLLKLQVSMH